MSLTLLTKEHAVAKAQGACERAGLKVPTALLLEILKEPGGDGVGLKYFYSTKGRVAGRPVYLLVDKGDFAERVVKAVRSIPPKVRGGAVVSEETLLPPSPEFVNVRGDDDGMEG